MRESISVEPSSARFRPRNIRRTPYDARDGATATSATPLAAAFSASRTADPNRVRSGTVRYGSAVLGEQLLVDVFKLARPFRERQLVLHAASRRPRAFSGAFAIGQRRGNRGAECARVT